MTLLGPSGCGKTTLLRILGGFLTPNEGTVLFDGEDISKIPPYKREINTVFQKYIIAYVKSSGVPVVCCGDVMKELVPNTTDAAVEKHVPVIHTDGQKVTVTVGSAKHPMLEEHYIEWIALATKQGNQRKELKPGQEPQAEFMISEDDEVLEVYAYCNLHGLWKA